MSVLDRLSDCRVGRSTETNEPSICGALSEGLPELAVPKHGTPGCAVAVVVTESCASVLGAAHELRHLQDVGENWCKSLVSLPRAFSSPQCSGTAQLLFIYGRRPNMSMEDTSNASILTGEEDQPKEENISHILEETPAWCDGPVLQVRSIAHDNRLVLSERGSRLLIRVIDDAASNCTDSGWHNFCRICHGGESIEQLVAPCRCRGSVALAHITCLERWLKESGSDTCELCNQRYHVVRRPRYPLLKSIFIWATDRNARGPHLLEDVAAFCLYTPSALTATYALMILCDYAARLHLHSKVKTAHLVAFAAVAGMAAIDFTYTSWLMGCIQKHAQSWREWFDDNCQLTIVLPPRKRRKPKKEKFEYEPKDIKEIPDYKVVGSSNSSLS